MAMNSSSSIGGGEDYNEYEVNNTRWIVPKRYSNLTPLGAGAYGLVCSADDSSIPLMKVAMKKLSKPFATNVHAKRAYREIKLLKHVNHDNVIRLLDLFTRADTADEINDIYLVTNLMGTDLNNVLKTQELSNDQIIFFAYQLLRGLKYLHSSNIIHRDLKPGNLTVNENCELRIIDFGLARSEREEMTGYVATRWYRAPEIMLKWMHYTKSVDIWSAGCIIVEMYIHRPLFPGSDHVNQLNRILAVVGYPTEGLLGQINEDARSYLEKIDPKPQFVSFKQQFPEIASTTAIDLAEKMLKLDPAERITCEQGLAHPYLGTFHDSDDEPEGEYFDDMYEKHDYSIAEWKNLIHREVVTFVAPDMVDI